MSAWYRITFFNKERQRLSISYLPTNSSQAQAFQSDFLIERGSIQSYRGGRCHVFGFKTSSAYSMWGHAFPGSIISKFRFQIWRNVVFCTLLVRNLSWSLDFLHIGQGTNFTEKNFPSPFWQRVSCSSKPQSSVRRNVQRRKISCSLHVDFEHITLEDVTISDKESLDWAKKAINDH
jgi:hypothetical protein